MRSINTWYLPIKDDLDKDSCLVELLLYLGSVLVPNATTDSLWVLLTGYSYPLLEWQNWTEDNYRMLALARHLLPSFERPFIWQESLKIYQKIPLEIRGYEIYQVDKNYYHRKRTNIAVANNRFQIYHHALTNSVELAPRKVIAWAESGTYKCQLKEKKETVEISSAIASLQRPPGHDLTITTQRKPLRIPWDELRQTALWMDRQKQSQGLEPEWVNRFDRIQLQIFNDNQELIDAEFLTIDKVMHLAGMVSSGKSNLMKILAVLVWRKKLHVTLVVADVLQIFELIKTFADVGIKDVAPILGNSNKISHLDRLHKAVYNSNPKEIFNQTHPAFQWLSSTCLLTSLVSPKMETAFEIGKQPCFDLEPTKVNNERSQSSLKEKACPAYGVCPSHKKERDLVNASIWIATPGSLIYSRVPRPINRESIYYFELICRRSDLVIIDEVDQQQEYLDKAFSPDKTLCRPTRDAWLNKLHDYVEAKLKSDKSIVLTNNLVSDWWDACRVANGTADKIYNLLSNENDLAKWRDFKNYFTDWLLLREVAGLLSINDPESLEQSEQCSSLMKEVFEPYIKDLDNETSSLFILAKKDKKADAIQQWIQQKATIPLSIKVSKEIAVKLEFALLVCLLQNKLYFITNNWRQVQGILNLDIADSMWFDAPPSDFNAIIPAMPMGNQLAFQYHKSYKERLGSLQFFRCTGVGRWLLLHFNELFRGDNLVSPHLLLMSGTSWAGKSSAYHVDIPVSGVLLPKPSQKIVINSRFLPFFDRDQKPISVSGAGDSKRRNLEQIVTQLVEEEHFTEKLKELNGRKILLLVNSYEQVDWVYQCLARLGWKDKAISLSPDDESPNEWSDTQDSNRLLQRGQSSDFADKSEVILIAPLKAIERGHNIVDKDGVAIVGAAYFLVLPHPIPDDLSFAIHAINRWAVDNYKEVKGENLKKLGENFRDAAYRQWLYLLHLSVRLRILPKNEREAMYWDILVCLWQVMGRMIRGNANAQVFWCDAKFAPDSAANEDGKEDTAATSLLVGIVNLLHPFFANDTQIPLRERLLVQSLYYPLYQALSNTINLSGLPKITV
jgi:hypothetical protein